MMAAAEGETTPQCYHLDRHLDKYPCVAAVTSSSWYRGRHKAPSPSNVAVLASKKVRTNSAIQ